MAVIFWEWNDPVLLFLHLYIHVNLLLGFPCPVSDSSLIIWPAYMGVGGAEAEGHGRGGASQQKSGIHCSVCSLARTFSTNVADHCH